MNYHWIKFHLGLTACTVDSLEVGASNKGFIECLVATFRNKGRQNCSFINSELVIMLQTEMREQICGFEEATENNVQWYSATTQHLGGLAEIILQYKSYSKNCDIR